MVMNGVGTKDQLVIITVHTEEERSGTTTQQVVSRQEISIKHISHSESNSVPRRLHMDNILETMVRNSKRS